MQRWFRAVILFLALAGLSTTMHAQILLTGDVQPGEVRILDKDNLYTIDGRLRIFGTVLVEPGAVLEFKPNGRLIVAAGGRLIADGRVFARYNDPFDPLTTVKIPGNPPTFYSGYADLDYFAAPGVYTAPNIAEPTVNFNKADALFRVDLSNSDSRLQNLTPGGAMLYKLARLENANIDPNINQRPWSRLESRDIDVVPSRITMRGNPVNSFSREWGHIVVLPGARAAYFRDVDFQNFRKDTTVDRFVTNEPYYDAPQGQDSGPYDGLSARMAELTNGSGGALTTFSVRTWLVSCKFEDNMARYRGGAVQFLQAPEDNFGANGTPGVYPNSAPIVSGLSNYPAGTNPAITDHMSGQEIQQNIKAIDELRNPTAEPLTDMERQLVDDGRLAIFLCRVRQLTFRNNELLVSDHAVQFDDNNVPIGTDDVLDAPATIDSRSFKNGAFGGAMYIAGRNQMILSLGVNHECSPETDYILFEGNTATNLQPASGNTFGARGGALFVGSATSLIIGGRFADNTTNLGFNDDLKNQSLGGAIYASSGANWVNVRGGRQQADNALTYFERNMSGSGGAIYQEQTGAVRVASPIIGGSDFSLATRDYGFNIKFRENQAAIQGGAVYTKKSTWINGAGGTIGTATNYGGNFRVEFRDNWAGYAGGGLMVDIDDRSGFSPIERRSHVIRSHFWANTVSTDSTLDGNVQGGGAIYAQHGDMYEVRATEFLNNRVWYGNGGAVALVNVGRVNNRSFITDFDVLIDGDVVENPQSASQDPYTYNSDLPPDVRSLTRFLGNRAIPDMDNMGSGSTQEGDNIEDRIHPGLRAGLDLLENGTGLGGALYILDESDIDRLSRPDRVNMNRVRVQDNEAFSGGAVYSDNYNLAIALTRSLVTGNVATSDIGRDQNAIFGPMVGGINPASSDLAGAVLYGEIVGPLPYVDYHTGANAIYSNEARFLIRLPDAPNTKGSLARGLIGAGRISNMQGNYWGHSEANVTTVIERTNTLQSTFFFTKTETNQLTFVRGSSNLKHQGPFEHNANYTYTPIPVSDDFDVSIPEVQLFQGHVYDIFDKGTDAKSLDYSNRRMARIEDFAVGIPPRLRQFENVDMPSFGKVVKRWTRDPFVAETDDKVAQLQTEMHGAHAIGYPLFLEAHTNYDGDVNRSNNDNRAIHETVYFVINENTGDYIRASLQQVDPTSEVFRGRVELVPDSSNRYFNVLDRRTAEGLSNFGGGSSLLQNVSAKFQRENFASQYDAAKNEDQAALKGRRYEATPGRSGGAGFGYSNRPALDPNVELSHYGGERFTALPVRVGDTVRVISRTVLWKDGVNEAIAQGLKFGISASTMPPVLTGFKVQTEENQIEGYEPADGIDVIFLTEDLEYPQADSDNHPGRDSIFAITATDVNRNIDPRSLFDGDNFTQMEYEWEVASNSGLSRWLTSKTIYPNSTEDDPVLHGATGWVHLIGRPTNPYIVPGGEVVTVRARNWAPYYRTIDSLRSIGVSEEEIAKYIYLYRPYFSACDYMTDQAKYLQQDSTNLGFNATSEYRFRIIVTDSIPVFEEEDFACQKGNGDTLVASVLRDASQFLRFQVDINTDDEREDRDAESTGWDFRYGRTKYGYEIVDIRPNPEDTARDNQYQNRPQWLGADYLADDNGNLDGGLAFTDRGFIRVEIPYTEALGMLTPPDQVNQALVTDTSFTVIVSDGHGGTNTRTYPVLINYQPLITTESLDPATEDEDYNEALLDSTRAIKALDPNFGQNLTFELLYAADQGRTILRDECYPEAGDWNDIVSAAATPEWLLIDPISGRLYGTPRVKDAPRLGGDAETVTVLVRDECGLTHIRQLTLEINEVNHGPELLQAPPVECVDFDGTFEETFTVRDVDLERAIPNSAAERITLSVDEPAGWTVTPQVVSGPITGGESDFTVSGTPPAAEDRNSDGSVTVRIRAVDDDGEVALLVFRIAVSDATNFISEIRITNSLGAEEFLQWGTAADATTGKDEDAGGIGKLDSNYCEYEIPPVPVPPTVFDARWDIPLREGTLRNIVPRSSNKPLTSVFQSGGTDNGLNYPIEICWDRTVFEDPEATAGDGMDWFIRDGDTKGNRFLINMREPVPYNRLENDVILTVEGDSVCLRILTSNVSGFEIVKEETAVVSVWEDPNQEGESILAQNTPNPFNGNTSVAFRVAEAGPVMLEVFDAIGNKVATLANGFYTPGQYSVAWDGRNEAGREVSNGVYVYRMTVGTQSVTRQMILVR